MVTREICEPPPQDMVQVSHASNLCEHGSGQLCVLQTLLSVVTSAQDLPPNCGATWVRVRVEVPPLHEVLHVLQAV